METVVTPVKGNGYICKRIIKSREYVINIHSSDEVLILINTDDQDFINLAKDSK